MRKNFFMFLLFMSAVFAVTSSRAQTVKITGTVINKETKEPIPSVSVLVKGSASTGGYTNNDGKYQFSVKKLPVTLVFSSIGYQSYELEYRDITQKLEVALSPSSTMGEEVVVSASRVPEKIMASPVSIDRINVNSIKTAPAASYYDVVTNFKGVDVISSSLTFKTPTTRGFGGSGSTRFNQIMDGMDNQAPGLNFSVGSVIGLTELDVESMELLPGASSALYGPGGMQGTLIVNGKNPFKYQGLSFQVKTGIMHTDGRSRVPSPYHDWSLRWGHVVNDRLAFKLGAQLIQAKDWLADDYRNYKRLGTSGNIIDGTRATDPNYDGVNVYGDETSVNLRSVLNIIAGAAPFWADYVKTLPSSIMVSRTGYTEKEVANPNTLNFKLSGAIHYKLTDKVEAILAAHSGSGNTVYTGSQRYSLRNLVMSQYKLELRSDKWFLKGYTTQENSGSSHNLTIASQLFNEAWSPSSTWYQNYAITYLNAKMNGKNEADAHTYARSIADATRPVAGSATFKNLFNQVIQKPIPQGGKFLDKSDLWMVEGQYNLKGIINFADILIGGNWKQYVLNSEGTLFADKKGAPIKINETGAYVQVAKQIIENLLKVTFSGRFDKNQNFKARFTPRVTALLSPNKDNNIRFSYQTAYRFPSTQQQWIDLNVGINQQLIGGNKALWDKYNLTSNNPYTKESILNGTNIRLPYTEAKPESVKSYELGYKGLLRKKLLFDMYGYYGQYTDFLSRIDVLQTTDGSVPALANITTYPAYSVIVNLPQKLKTYGWGLSLDWMMRRNFVINGNISSDQISDVPVGYRSFFSTPKLRTVLGIGNTGFGKDKLLGFNLSWRWQDGFFYENDFIQGDLPAYNTVDASFSIKRPKIKSIFKFGANNALNQYYRTAMGNPSIGGLYYVSFGYNVL